MCWQCLPGHGYCSLTSPSSPTSTCPVTTCPSSRHSSSRMQHLICRYQARSWSHPGNDSASPVTTTHTLIDRQCHARPNVTSPLVSLTRSAQRRGEILTPRALAQPTRIQTARAQMCHKVSRETHPRPLLVPMEGHCECEAGCPSHPRTRTSQPVLRRRHCHFR